MARYRRSRNRSTSQRAVSLVASALPAPVQRIAETSLGSTLLFFGIPILVVAGVLQLSWEGGIPHFSIDRNRAEEIKNVARDELEKINPAKLQEWENSAIQVWNEAQAGGRSATNDMPHGNSYGQTYRQQQPSYSYPQAYPQPQTYPQQSYQQSQPSYQQQPPYYQSSQAQQPYYQQPQYQANAYPSYQQQSYQPPANGYWRQ